MFYETKSQKLPTLLHIYYKFTSYEELYELRFITSLDFTQQI